MTFIVELWRDRHTEHGRREIEYHCLQFLLLAWFFLMGFLSCMLAGAAMSGALSEFLAFLAGVCQLIIVVGWVAGHVMYAEAISEAYPEFDRNKRDYWLRIEALMSARYESEQPKNKD